MPEASRIRKENVNVRLPEGLHLKVKEAAPGRCGTVEKAYEQALTAWLAQMAESVRAGQGTVPQTSVPQKADAGRITKAVLKLQEAVDILENVQAASVSGATDDTSGKTRTLLDAQKDDPRTPRDLGTGTGQPASWRKGYRRGKRPGPTGKD